MSTPPEFPEWPDAPFATVTWRRATVGGDSLDDGQNPDWAARVGQTVRLIPSISGPVVYDPYGPDPITVDVLPVDCVIDENGYLTLGGIPVNIISSVDPLMSAQGWTWTVEGFPNIRFTTPSGGVVDLSRYVLAPAVDSTKFWVDRIPDLIELIPDLKGITSIVPDGGDILITLSDGTETRFAIPSATWATLTGKPDVFPPALPVDEDTVIYYKEDVGIVEVVDGSVRLTTLGSENNEIVTLSKHGLQLQREGSGTPGSPHWNVTYGRNDIIYAGHLGPNPSTLKFPMVDGWTHTIMTDRLLEERLAPTPWYDVTDTLMTLTNWQTSPTHTMIIRRDATTITVSMNLNYIGSGARQVRYAVELTNQLPIGWRPVLHAYNRVVGSALLTVNPGKIYAGLIGLDDALGPEPSYRITAQFPNAQPGEYYNAGSSTLRAEFTFATDDPISDTPPGPVWQP